MALELHKDIKIIIDLLSVLICNYSNYDFYSVNVFEYSFFI